MESKIKIVTGTSNPHKIKEMNEIANGFPFEFVLPDCKNFDPIECGKTFEENAEIKAKEAARVSSGEFFIADDSGLCVDFLNGAPGIHSARYANTQEARINKLLMALEGAENRFAHFVCALCLVNKEGKVIHKETGFVQGEIARNKRGKGGFGYDPVFIVKNSGKTMAELTEEEKNTLSHRGQALNNMLKWMKEVIYDRKL